MEDRTSQIILVIKFILVFFIALSPFLSFQSFQFLNTLPVKLILLIVIVASCFIDFQLAIIATIAFLICIINMNTSMLNSTYTQTQQNQGQQDDTKRQDNFENWVKTNLTQAQNLNEKDTISLDTYFSKPVKSDIKDVTKNLACKGQDVDPKVNESLMSRFIDEKIKPYDVYISMLTNKENLDKAQGVIV